MERWWIPWDRAEAMRVEEWPARLGYHRVSVNTFDVFRLSGQLETSGVRLRIDPCRESAPWVRDDLAVVCVAVRGCAHHEALSHAMETGGSSAPSAWVAYSGDKGNTSKPLGVVVVSRGNIGPAVGGDKPELHADILLHPSLERRRALDVVLGLLRTAQPTCGFPTTLTADERVALTLQESSNRIVPLSTAVCVTVTSDAHQKAKRLLRRAEHKADAPTSLSRQVA